MDLACSWSLGLGVLLAIGVFVRLVKSPVWFEDPFALLTIPASYTRSCDYMFSEFAARERYVCLYYYPLFILVVGYTPFYIEMS